jgi:hypothetical protein
MDKKLPIFTRGAYWYCYVRTAAGKRLQRALHIRNDGSRESERAAVAAYWQEQARATAGSLDQPVRPRITLGEALRSLAEQQALAELSDDRHRTVYRASKHLLAHYGADFDVLTLTSTAGYVEYATKARAWREAITVRQELGVFAQAIRAVGLNPPKLPKLGGLKAKPQEPLTTDELRRFMLALKPKYKLLGLTLVSLGIRTSEYRKITEVDWNTRMVWVHGTKTRRSKRWVPVPDELWEVMESMRARGEWNGFPPVSDKMIDVTVRNACVRAGIGPRSVNDLRGTYSTALSLQGVSAAVRAALQGNGELMQVATYSQPHLRPEELRGSVDKLPRITGKATQQKAREA